jgi:peptidoglycan/xylan/chitin deacetylase (PgdA/CDA1 family)
LPEWCWRNKKKGFAAEGTEKKQRFFTLRSWCSLRLYIFEVMKSFILFLICTVCLLAMVVVISGTTTQKPPQRAMAITIDDLPEAPPGVHNLKTVEAINRKLVRKITSAKVPAIGFVNEGKLYNNNGKEVADRTALLKLWLDAGLELGNHSYSHPDLFTMPLEQFKADVLRGEQVTRRLLAAKGMKPRYFRYPFLHTGPNLETKQAFEKFLGEHGYKVAPVTVDNNEYIFAAVYADAMQKNESAAMKRIGAAYVPYMEKMLELYEKHSVSLFGRDIKQTLLLHGNALNADYFDELVEMMKRRGYRFVSLEDALTDEAYRSADTYAGRAGLSWLQRWAITRNHQPTKELFKLEPEVTEFVRKAYEQRNAR